MSYKFTENKKTFSYCCVTKYSNYPVIIDGAANWSELIIKGLEV